MMHPRRMRELLQSFADGELSAAKQSWVEHHLASCADCAASLRSLQESDRLFSVARPEPEALSPEAAHSLFSRALEQAQGQRATFRPSAQPFSWAFGAALAVTAGAAFAWWGMAGVSPGAGEAPVASLRPPAGLFVADTGTRTGAVSAVRKGSGGSRAGSGSGTVPGQGASTRPKKETPTLEAPGAKSPADGKQPQRTFPFRHRYVADAHGPERGTGAGIELVSGPLPESFVDLQGANGGSPVVPGQLLVLVSPEAAPSPVAVTCASAEAPGFARASAVRPDGSGGWLWTEATVQNECAGPERSLVILGSSAWPWEEEQDDQVWGEPDHEVGDSGDTAGAVSEPARDPGSGGVTDQDEGQSAGASEPACDNDPVGPGDIDADGC
jgi:anti-sigma factor RsiW